MALSVRKAEAIRKALEARRLRIRLHARPASRGQRTRAFLEREVWPFLDPGEAGRTLTKEETEALAGYGPEGV